jgi:hypothetical protein
MTPDERRQFNEILSHGSMLNVSEQFLVDLVVKLETEVNQALQARLCGVQAAQAKYSIEHQHKHKAIAALHTVLARLRYGGPDAVDKALEMRAIADWKAPMPSPEWSPNELADKAQYQGRLEDYIEQQLEGLK